MDVITTEDELKAAIRGLYEATEVAKTDIKGAADRCPDLNTVTGVVKVANKNEILVRTNANASGVTVKYVPSAYFAKSSYDVQEQAVNATTGNRGGYYSNVTFTGKISVKEATEEQAKSSDTLAILWPRGDKGKDGAKYTSKEMSHSEYVPKLSRRGTVNFTFSTAGVTVKPCNVFSASATALAVSGTASSVSVIGQKNSFFGYSLQLIGVFLSMGGTKYAVAGGASNAKAIFSSLCPFYNFIKAMRSATFVVRNN